MNRREFCKSISGLTAGFAIFGISDIGSILTKPTPKPLQPYGIDASYPFIKEILEKYYYPEIKRQVRHFYKKEQPFIRLVK